MKKLYVILILSLATTSILGQNIEENLKNHKIKLPAAPAPVGNYVPYKVAGKLVFINQVALVEGKILAPGVIGKEVTEEQAKEAARQTMLNVIAVLKQATNGDLDKVKQAVQMTGIFNTPEGYTQHALLMNEASNLLVDIFGEKGVHTRATLGASSIPINSPVEIQAIFELE